MKKSVKIMIIAALFLASTFLIVGGAMADTCVGNCGTLGANGDVTLAPGSSSNYQFVSTLGGISGNLLSGIGGTNGSTLTTSAFSALAGDNLNFYFNYVTSDGSQFADYAWVLLLDASSAEVALLFTARTTPGGNTVPGFGMPIPTATLVPPSTPIIDGASHWSALGGYSGACYMGVGQGCGSTGWIKSNYTIANAGSYFLQFGVANYLDTAYDSGLAFDGLKVNDIPINPTPEPATMLLIGLGLMGLAGVRRKIKK